MDDPIDISSDVLPVESTPDDPIIDDDNLPNELEALTLDTTELSQPQHHPETEYAQDNKLTGTEGYHEGYRVFKGGRGGLYTIRASKKGTFSKKSIPKKEHVSITGDVDFEITPSDLNEAAGDMSEPKVTIIDEDETPMPNIEDLASTPGVKQVSRLIFDLSVGVGGSLGSIYKHFKYTGQAIQSRSEVLIPAWGAWLVERGYATPGSSLMKPSSILVLGYSFSVIESVSKVSAEVPVKPIPVVEKKTAPSISDL